LRDLAQRFDWESVLEAWTWPTIWANLTPFLAARRLAEHTVGRKHKEAMARLMEAWPGKAPAAVGEEAQPLAGAATEPTAGRLSRRQAAAAAALVPPAQHERARAARAALLPESEARLVRGRVCHCVQIFILSCSTTAMIVCVFEHAQWR
jgi:hypothetical protein